MSGELSGKTAIVTGAGHGIGLAIAKKLAGEGATAITGQVIYVDGGWLATF